MSNNSWLLMPFFLFFMPFYSTAQQCSGTISGLVLDGRTNSPLIGASIELKSVNQVAVSKADGSYLINGFCPGKYSMTISFIGYQSKEITILLKEKLQTNISLFASDNRLAEVRVEGVRPEIKPLQINNQLDGKALEMTRGESLGESLKAIAGVNSIQTGPTISKPIIQGLYGNRVLIHNAGVRQEGQQWGSEHAPEIDPFIAGQLTVVKGAATVMYGADAIGGVVLVEPAPLNYHTGLRGQVNLVGMSNSGLGAFSGMIEGGPGLQSHFSWRLQGTVRVAGNSKTADYYLKNTGLREYNGALILGYHYNNWKAEVYASSFNTKLGIFSGSNVGSTADRNNAIGRPEPLAIYQSNLNYLIERPYQLVNHQLIKSKVSYLFENIGTVNLQYSYQQNYRREYDVVRASSQDDYQYKFDLSTQVADFYLDHKTIAGLSGRIGAGGIVQQNYYDGAYLIPFFKSYNGSLYLIERWNSGNLGLEAGFRYDKKFMQVTKRISPKDNNSPIENPEFNFNQLSGTVGSSYMLPANYKLTATIAKGWRPPAINELFIEGVHQGNASFEKGDRKLKEESSLNLSVGITRHSGKLTGDINFYHNKIDGYIYLQPQLDASGAPIFEITQRGGFLSNKYVQLNARFTGLDAMLDYEIDKHFSLNGKYSIVRAYDQATHDHLIYIPADKVTGSIRYSLPNFKSFNATTIDFSTSYVARQNQVRDDQDFAPAPAAYTLLDATVASSITIGAQQWNIGLTVNNIMNVAYRDYLNRFRYYTDDIGRNITLRLQIPFGTTHN
ncbi:iron complex outermembrane receptor protein [Pedobacter sp. UYP24]